PAQPGLHLVREPCVVGESQPGAFGEILLDVLGGLVRCAGYGVSDAAEDVLDPRCERGGLWHCSPSCSVAWWRVYSPPAAGAFRKTPPAGLAEESMARAVVSVDSHAGDIHSGRGGVQAYSPRAAARGVISRYTGDMRIS